MSSKVRDLSLIVALSTLVFVGNLGGTKLWDEDEPRNARCAVEMLDRDDLVVPTFNGELRTHKPVLLYWLMIASYQIFGVNEFAARFPSALCGLGTTLCVWLCGRRLFGARAGFLTGIALLTSLMFDVMARAATPDSVYVFCMTLAITVFVRSTLSVCDNRPGMTDFPAIEVIPRVTAWFPATKVSLTLFYLALGFAMLAKGPIGFLLPMAIVGMFLLVVRTEKLQQRSSTVSDSTLTRGEEGTWRRSIRLIGSWFAPGHFLKTVWTMRPLSGTVISLAIALPWYFAVGSQTQGEWLRGFFLEHNLGRATSAMENHSGPFLIYYVVAIAIGFFPWSVFLVPSLLDVRRRLHSSCVWNPGVVLSLCWIAVPVVLFSLASTKLPSYVTPGYPGLALLVGTFLDRCVSSRATVSTWWVRTGFVTVVGVGVLLVIASGFAISQYFSGEYLLLIPGTALLLGASYGIRCFNKNRIARSLQVYAGTATAFAIGIFQVAAPQVSQQQKIESLFAAASDRTADIATFEVLQSSWVFYANQTLEHFDSRRIDQLKEFLANQPSHFVIAKESRVNSLADEVGLPLSVAGQVPWFLKGHQHGLVLLRASTQPNILTDANSDHSLATPLAADVSQFRPPSTQ